MHTHTNFWNTWTQIHTHSWSINTQREPLRLSSTASTKHSEQCCDSSSYRYPEACEWAASEDWGLWVIWLAAVYLWGCGGGVVQTHRVVWGRQEGGQEQDPGTLGKLVCWGWQLQMTLSDVTPVGCRCLRTQETALRVVSLTLSPVPPALSRWTDLDSCWATSASLASSRVISPHRNHPSTLERTYETSHSKALV